MISKNYKEKKRRLKLPASGMKQNITMYPADIKRIIKACHKQPYTHKFDNLVQWTNSSNCMNYLI